MPEIKLISERTGIVHGTDVIKREYVVDDCYNIHREIFGENIEYFSIKVLKRNEYIPQLYVEEDVMEDLIYGFAIQTTSYGSLEKVEIRKMIKGYQYALDVVELLEKEFASSLSKRPKSNWH